MSRLRAYLRAPCFRWNGAYRQRTTEDDSCQQRSADDVMKVTHQRRQTDREVVIRRHDFRSVERH